MLFGWVELMGWHHVLMAGVGGYWRAAVSFPQVEGAIGRAGQLLK
jgi:hypothetical protein